MHAVAWVRRMPNATVHSEELPLPKVNGPDANVPLWHKSTQTNGSQGDCVLNPPVLLFFPVEFQLGHSGGAASFAPAGPAIAKPLLQLYYCKHQGRQKHRLTDMDCTFLFFPQISAPFCGAVCGCYRSKCRLTPVLGWPGSSSTLNLHLTDGDSMSLGLMASSVCTSSDMLVDVMDTDVPFFIQTLIPSHKLSCSRGGGVQHFSRCPR